MKQTISSSTLSHKLFYSIRSVNEEMEKWVFPSRLLLEPKYLQALEESCIRGMETVYVLIFDEKKAVGLIYFQAINLAAKELGSIIHLDPYGKFLNLVSDKLNRLLFSHEPGQANWLLVCGNMNVSGQYAFSCLSGYEKPLCLLLPEIILHINQELEKRGKLSAVIVKDFPFSDDPLQPILEKEGFIRFVMDPIMVIDHINDWQTFDDYLNAMSAKYRLRANNAIKKIANLTERNFELEEIEKNAGRINELYLAVQQRSPVRVLKPDVNCFIQYKKHLGKNFFFKALYHDEKLIAFMTGIFNDRDYEAHHIGIDYHYNKEYALYQNILYLFIKEAINVKVKTLSFGRTALEMKTTVGAKPVDHAAYMRLNNKLLNKLVKPFLPSASPSNWIPRDPFKNND